MAATAQIHSVIPTLFTSLVEGMLRMNAQAVRGTFDVGEESKVPTVFETLCVQLKNQFPVINR